jgi:predicted O-methyltransferase YrrM
MQPESDSPLHQTLVRLARHSAALRLLVYAREVTRFRRAGKQQPPLAELVRRFPAWQRTLKPNASPLGDRAPWLTYDAIRFLERIVRPDMRVFEYGAGGSSLFFATRVREGFSVEHDPAWAAEVQQTVAAQGIKHWQVELIRPAGAAAGPDPADPAHYLSSGTDFAGQSFRDYAAAIDRFADGWFQVVVVDGRARPSCARHAVPKLAPGGWLLLDNAERPHYARVRADLARLGWVEQTFAGPSPYTFNFTETCAWQKPPA